MAESEKKKSRKRKYLSSEIEARAVDIVRQEKIRWETSSAFVTDRVSFKMRNLIRLCRKNYYGVFDQPMDQFTGAAKVWYPLTEINVEAVVKNIDLDQKDLGFRSKTSEGVWMTDLTRAHVKDKLSRMYFGQALDDMERQLAIDGTVVWKTFEEYGKMQRRDVDILNVYLDPTTPSIQAAYRFTERSLMFPEEIMAMSGWMNTSGMQEGVPQGLPRTDPYWMNRSSTMNSNVAMWDVYELWGKIPKSLITGDMKDDSEEVEGHMVVSGIDGGKPRCHLIELNTKIDREGNYVKPYEEAWYTRVPNRWYGRGVAEKLLMMQVYANIMFNIRINKARVSQLGLFKVKKGAGITPQQLSRLPVNGAIVLNNMTDLEQFVMQDVQMSSYKDEEVINSISDRLTSAFDVVTGEAMPTSTPATNAAIQNANAKSGFQLIKEGIGLFLQRWMDRHALPILAKELKVDEIVRIMGSEENFAALVDRVLPVLASETLDEYYKQGYLPDPLEFQAALDSAREKMMRGDMFVTLVKDIMVEQLDTEFYVSNEEMDVALTVQNLLGMLPLAPEYRDDIVRQTYDLLGLSQPKPNKQPIAPNPMLPPAAGGGMPPMGAPATQGAQMQDMTQAAMVPQR